MTLKKRKRVSSRTLKYKLKISKISKEPKEPKKPKKPKKSKKLRQRIRPIRPIDFNDTISKLANANLLTIEKVKNALTIVNVFDLIKDIKQLEVILHFLKKRKEDRNQKLNLRIVVPSRFAQTMLKRYLLEINRRSSIKITNNLLGVKPNTILFIFSENFKNDREVLLKKLMIRKIFVFFTPTGIFGSYNLFINDFNLKKLFFFLTLLNKILTNGKN